MKSFNEFWPYYAAEHSKPGTRILHFVGTIVATGLFVTFVVMGKWLWLPLAFVPGYAAAWVSHFFIQHNRPATFKHPLWSFIGDYKMVAMMIAGKMDEEVARATRERV